MLSRPVSQPEQQSSSHPRPEVLAGFKLPAGLGAQGELVPSERICSMPGLPSEQRAECQTQRHSQLEEPRWGPKPILRAQEIFPEKNERLDFFPSCPGATHTVGLRDDS